MPKGAVFGVLKFKKTLEGAFSQIQGLCLLFFAIAPI